MRTRSLRGTVRSGGLVALLALVFIGGAVHEAFAQTPYVPYYGKNRIRYDDFKWKIYTTEHFEIYYYPEIEQHLERVAGLRRKRLPADQLRPEARPGVQGADGPRSRRRASSSSRTSCQGDIPKASPPSPSRTRDRMVLPIDEPPDMLYRLITHELTHIFEFDIIPRSLIRRGTCRSGSTRAGRLHGRRVAPARPDDGARRRPSPTSCRR